MPTFMNGVYFVLVCLKVHWVVVRKILGEITTEMHEYCPKITN